MAFRTFLDRTRPSRRGGRVSQLPPMLRRISERDRAHLGITAHARGDPAESPP